MAEKARSPQVFRLLLVSEGGCGKGTLLDRLQGQPFEEQYISSLWMEPKRIQIPTNKDFVFDVKEISRVSDEHERSHV